MPKPVRDTGKGAVKQGTNGADTLSGLDGEYTLVGGKGDDTYVVDSGDKVEEKNRGGVDTVVAQVDWTLEDHIENLTLDGILALSGTGNAWRI